jgi:hypothetical protein
MKRFIVLSIVLLMLAGFAITSSAMEVTLLAGQTIEVGTLTVAFDGTNLVVTYAMNPWNSVEEGWELLETHLYVGIDPPTKSAPGRFPYDAIDGVYEIDLEGFTGTLYIAAQAEIGMIDEYGDPVIDPDTEEQIEETAWAFGEDKIRPGKNWAMYFEFEVEP